MTGKALSEHQTIKIYQAIVGSNQDNVGLFFHINKR